MTDYKIFAANSQKAQRIDSTESIDLFIRDNYQVDRDRILYSKAFRRLRGKTQVFIAGYDDHVRNRLSHTLEVSQIARTISNALGLNDALTEAIALGHDLGHTPFGHVGERTLNKILSKELKLAFDVNIADGEKGFKHNWQSVRVACHLEYHSRKYTGLNLTKETLWGFLHHSNLNYDGKPNPFFEDKYKCMLPDEECWSFEGIVVSLADEIAQRHHDIEDGLITGILEKDNLINYLNDKIYNELSGNNVEKFRILLGEAQEKYPEFYFETIAKAIVNFYVEEVVCNTKKIFEEIVEKYSVTDNECFLNLKKTIWCEYIKNEKDLIKKMMSEPLYNADKKLQDEYLKKRILHSYQAQKNDGKAAYIIKKIVEAYLTNPQQMPDNGIIMLFARDKGIDSFPNNPSDLMESIFERGKDKSEIVGDMRVKLADEIAQETWSSSPLYKSLLRTIVDYVAGMTDDYAIAIYEQLYGGTKQNRY